MNEEIQEIFDAAMEEYEPLAAANRRIAELEARAAEDREQAMIDCAVAAAVEGCGTLDPELTELLLRRAGICVESGRVAGVREAVEELRKTRPWLFADGGGRPCFCQGVQGRSLGREDEIVARRYRNNPWYRGQ